MERDTERFDDLVDLGTASVETLGGLGIPLDESNGQYVTGLSDD